MPRTKTTLPAPSKEKGQRSLELPDYITRILPIWRNPGWLNGDVWRDVVKQQPIAMICRETLIENVESLDWKIDVRDSTTRDEHKKEIDYYTKFFSNNGEQDFTTLIEWITQDYLDLPFGSGVELGREGDSPTGKVHWIRPIDGATLFPTLNVDWPVGQFLKESPGDYVYFPKHAINRLYMSPRTEIRREGWGMAPPEKIYLSLELLNRGDVYYANLLLDTPPAGILDLKDMSKDSAESWLNSWKGLLGGTDPFKIPVLYEHEQKAEFVSFTKPPAELMFDKATMKYTAITTAGYGMSISDIGLPTLGNGGETLAGSIRQERRTRRTGFGIIKKKIKYFFDRILPEYLEFKWIDLDDELNVAIGRARLASATAWDLLVSKGVFTRNEARQQLIADGLVTISAPESIEGGDEIVSQTFPPTNPNNTDNKQSNMLGKPVPPSKGGQGEIKLSDIEDSDSFSKDLGKIFVLSDATLRRIIRSAMLPVALEAKGLYNDLIDNNILDYWNDVYDNYLLSGIDTELSDLMLSTTQLGLSNMKSSYPIHPNVFSADTKEYLLGLFLDLYKTKTYQKLLREYETGNIDVEPNIESIKVSKASIDKFLEKIDVLLSDYSEKAVETFYKTVLVGIRRHLTEDGNAIKLADELDIERFMGDNIVDTVKTYLRKSYLDLVENFGNLFVEESIKYLEEN